MVALKKHVSQFGFTLIELMVVIAIIGLLMAAGLVSYTTAQKNARDAKRESDIDAIGKAMEQYNAGNGSYPVAANYGAFSLGSSYLPGGNPTDPRNTGVYTYTLESTTTGFCACAGLENLGKGNSTAAAPTSGAPTCTFVAPASGVQGYFCVQNQQ